MIDRDRVPGEIGGKGTLGGRWRQLRGYRAIGYARGEAPLGYAEPGEDHVIEYDEDALAALDQDDDFA